MNANKISTWIGAITVAAAALVVFAGTAAAHMPMTITIRHQTLGCHAWSASPSGPYKPNLAVNVARGTRLAVVNNDVMPHRLVQLSGPKVTVTRANMNHMAAHAYVTFTHAGTYVFKTKAGEDYKWVHGMNTKGEDNVLRLKITVR